VTDKPERKSAAQQLREAMAAKKAAAASGKPKLRPDTGRGRANADAERRAGKSRKVH
jgi:hypothetical protein